MRLELDSDLNMMILDKSAEFTQPGVDMLNDSISNYIRAILGAQA